MEAEERPAKIRKTDHDGEILASPEPANLKASNNGTSPARPTENVHEDGIPSSRGGESPDRDHSAIESSAPAASASAGVEASDGTSKLSKNQLKKLKRKEQWEAGREDRKVKRREKIKAKKERRREAYQQDPSLVTALKAKKTVKASNQVVPVTIVFDCDFDDLMLDQELKSLGTQITRCYADNRNAAFKTHLAVASFGGKLKERYDGILAGQYKKWTGVKFLPDDFVAVAEKAKEWMSAANGDTIAGALEELEQDGADDTEGEVVYLSSESDNTLEKLKPYSTYIIGGLVDHNRHKGICYKRAVARGIKTAKLPIGDFLDMDSRKVLATNHVLEIMLKWLELGDWGEAFMQVIPKRKGGALRGEAEDSPAAGSIAEEEEETKGDSEEVAENDQGVDQSEEANEGK